MKGFEKSGSNHSVDRFTSWSENSNLTLKESNIRDEENEQLWKKWEIIPEERKPEIESKNLPKLSNKRGSAK